MTKYEIYKSAHEGEKCWCWRLKDDQGEEIAFSAEPLFKGEVIASVKKIRQEVFHAPFEGDTNPVNTASNYRFTCCADDHGGQLILHLCDNDKAVAISNAFPSESEAECALETIRQEMGGADITWESPEDDPAWQEKHDDRTETKGIPGS